MKTKEAILEERIAGNDAGVYSDEEIYIAMESYAQQQAIAFIKWAVEKNVLQADFCGGLHYSLPNGPHNEEQAYAQFIEQQQSKQP